MRTRSSGGGRVSLVLVLGLLPLVQRSCGGESTVERQRLSGSVSTLEELAAEVLVGLASADTARLERVRLDEAEHNELVWPELPAATSGAGFPVDVAWENISARNRSALSRLLSEHGGTEVDLRGVECRGPTREFESFVVHTDCWVSLTRDDERLPPKQIFQDVLDWDGELKIFRYYEP
jgi:hypothetical protein